MGSRLLLRLTIPIIGLSLLLLATGGISAWYIQQLNDQALQSLSYQLERSSAANDLAAVMSRTGSYSMQYAWTLESKDLLDAMDLAEVAREQLAHCQNLDVTLSGRRQLDKLAQSFERLTTLLIKLGLQREYHEPHQKTDLSSLAYQRLPAVLKESEAYRDLHTARLQQANTHTTSNARRIGQWLWLLALLGATAGLLGGYGVARALHLSMVELSVPIHTAAGKLDEVVGPLRIKAASRMEDLQSALDELARRVGTVVERLQAAQQENLRAEQLAATGQLAAGLAHELRNPLTAMKTLVQAARQGGSGGALDEQDLAILEEEMTRLSDTIQTFLDFARPPVLQRRCVDVAEVIHSTVQLVAPRASQQHVELHTELAPNLPQLEADPDQLRQTLLNLVLNAFDELPVGGRVLFRATHAPPAEPADEGSIVIEVVDNGPGLPADLGEHIFEPFRSTKEAGTGLGLAICKRIVENHGGSITARNGPAGGAVFSIRLPVSVPCVASSAT